MKTLMVILLSGVAWAAAADQRTPTQTCKVWAHPAMNNLLHENATAPIHPPGILFDDLDAVRAVSCAADPKLTPAVRLVWAQVLQEMIERRYDRDLEEAVK